MERLHYLARPADPTTNPDGLPIGFVKDPAPDAGGLVWLGLTCAACHTAQINFNGIAYRIDGGPGHGDVQTLLNELADALQKTHDDAQKFSRFAAKVLRNGNNEAARNKLRDDLARVTKIRSEYNDRNSSQHPYGYARVDAFGIIMNEVLVKAIDVPENRKEPNAPVSYPFLWDTPHHDFVQWNGAAPNRPLGTHILGPLARNVGEVLGVFGEVKVPVEDMLNPRYESSVHLENLFWIEQRLKKLQSPKWPDEFPAIDKSLKAKGEKIFVRDCRGCHHDIDRSDRRRRVVAVMTPLEDLKTDPLMAKNFEGRMARTGRLQDRPKLLAIGEKFGVSASAAEILRHTVAAVIKQGIIQRAEVTTSEELAKLRKLKELDDRSRLKDLTTLQSLRELREVLRALEELQIERLEDLREFVELAQLLDLKESNLHSLESLYKASGENNLLAYKGRPLNGIWATAPYLHNGSVPNLEQLLRPAVERDVTFTVGSRNFDPSKVGFESGMNVPNSFVFRVKDEQGNPIPGNSNSGHEYGTQLNETERRQLLEYLKTL